MPRSFDSQAGNFDCRAGLRDEVISSIVNCIEKLTKETADGTFLEVGAGTGQLGIMLNKLRHPYVGFDNSEAMLNEFKRQNVEKTELNLVTADGNCRWPVESGSVSVIFSSRALHLLDQRHVPDEVFRVAGNSRSLLLTGSIVRPEDSIRRRMRKQMRKFLSDSGFQGRHGKKQRQGLFNECCARGGEILEAIIAAHWKTWYSPQQSLDNWAGKTGMAGCDISEEIKSDVLRSLEDWARQKFGDDLNKQFEYEENYVLEGVRLN